MKNEVEEKAKEKVSWNDVKEKYLKFHRMDKFTENMAIDIDFGYWLANEVINEAMRWRDPKEELPEFISGCDYSNNVLAHVEGFTETQVMCLVFIPDDEGEWGYAWANCYGDINGEAEWDDNYKVIGWRPIE